MRVDVAAADRIYWEEQRDSLLCGVHCLNALLQFPALDEVRLGEIGRALDAREAQLTGLAVQHNVSDAGNFNVQVLVEALQEAGAFSVESARSAANRETDLAAETAFVCNHSDHWFCLRKVAGLWFNLNSRSPNGPALLSREEVQEFLAASPQKNRHVFVVRGSFPAVDPAFFAGALAPHQRYFAVAELVLTAAQTAGMKHVARNVDAEGFDSTDIARAVLASLDAYKQQAEAQPPRWEGAGTRIASDSAERGQSKFIDEDEDGVAAYRMSLRDKFPEGEGEEGPGVLIRVRLGNGRTVQRRFGLSQPLSDLYEFAFLSAEQSNVDFFLQKAFPKAIIPRTSATLAEAQLTDDQTLTYVRKS